MFGSLRVAWQLAQDGSTLAAAAVLTGERRVAYLDNATDYKLRPALRGEAQRQRAHRDRSTALRASLSYAANPYLPYTPLQGGTQAQGEPAFLYPVVSRVAAFVGLQYDALP